MPKLKDRGGGLVRLAGSRILKWGWPAVHVKLLPILISFNGVGDHAPNTCEGIDDWNADETCSKNIHWVGHRPIRQRCKVEIEIADADLGMTNGNRCQRRRIDGAETLRKWIDDARHGGKPLNTDWPIVRNERTQYRH